MSPQIGEGSCWRKLLFDTEAFYRAVRIEGEIVTVEVVSVPGLAPGLRIRFLRKAFETMDPISEAELAAAQQRSANRDAG